MREINSERKQINNLMEKSVKLKEKNNLIKKELMDIKKELFDVKNEMNCIKKDNQKNTVVVKGLQIKLSNSEVMKNSIKNFIKEHLNVDK